jgi:hypothetical protein
MERLIGTILSKFLDHIFFWNAGDLERKVADCFNSRLPLE